MEGALGSFREGYTEQEKTQLLFFKFDYKMLVFVSLFPFSLFLLIFFYLIILLILILFKPLKERYF